MGRIDEVEQLGDAGRDGPANAAGRRAERAPIGSGRRSPISARCRSSGQRRPRNPPGRHGVRTDPAAGREEVLRPGQPGDVPVAQPDRVAASASLVFSRAAKRKPAALRPGRSGSSGSPRSGPSFVRGQAAVCRSRTLRVRLSRARADERMHDGLAPPHEPARRDHPRTRPDSGTRRWPRASRRASPATAPAAAYHGTDGAAWCTACRLLFRNSRLMTGPASTTTTVRSPTRIAARVLDERAHHQQRHRGVRDAERVEPERHPRPRRARRRPARAPRGAATRPCARPARPRAPRATRRAQKPASASAGPSVTASEQRRVRAEQRAPHGSGPLPVPGTDVPALGVVVGVGQTLVDVVAHVQVAEAPVRHEQPECREHEELVQADGCGSGGRAAPRAGATSAASRAARRGAPTPGPTRRDRGARRATPRGSRRSAATWATRAGQRRIDNLSALT